MANPFDAFDQQAGSSTPPAAVAAGGGANPFDQFGSGLNDSSGDMPSDTTGSQATLGSVAKNAGTGMLAGIPDAISTFESVSPAGIGRTLMSAVGLPTLPDSGTLIKKGMGLVGINPDDASQLPQPRNAPERIARMGGEALAGSVLFPEGSLVRNAVTGLSGGLGAGIGEEVAPDSLKPAAGLAGGLIGGGIGLGAGEIPNAIAKTGSAARDFAAPMLGEGERQRLAGKILNNAASDPDAAIQNIDNAPELVPGSKPTTFQASGDLGLGQLERAIAAKNPQDFRNQAAEQNSARLDALMNIQNEGHPEAVADFFRSRLDQLDQATQDIHDRAAQAARSAAEGIGGTSAPETSGEAVRASLQGNLDNVKQQENALWSAVDPEKNMMTIATPIKKAWQSIYGELSPEKATSLSPAERALADIVPGYGQTLPLQRLIDLRSTVSQAMRDARSPLQPNSAAYGRLSQLRGDIEGAISDSIAQKAAQEQKAVSEGALQPEETTLQRWMRERDAIVNAQAAVAKSGRNPGAAIGTGTDVSSGQVRAGRQGIGQSGGTEGGSGSQGPIIDQDAANRLKQATSATKARHETFDTKPVSQILKRPGASYPYEMPGGQVAASVWKAGNAGGDAIRTVLKASPEAVEPIRDLAANSLRSSTGPDGIITPKTLTTWKAKHASALQALEEASPGTTAAFQDAARAAETMARIGERRKDALEAYQKSAIGKVMKVSDPSDVVKTVGSLLSGKDGVKAMRQLAIEAQKDPDAIEGLRKAVVDYMKSKLISNTEAATSGRDVIKSDQFQTFLGKHYTALRQVFNDEELGTMRAIAQDLKRANRSIAALKLPGGSNTTQDLLASSKHDLHQSILGKIMMHGAGALIGFSTEGGLIGATLGAIGSRVVSAAREAGIGRIDDLIREAMLDPKLAKTLMMKAPKKPDTGSEITLASRLRRMAAFVPAVTNHSSQEN